MVYLALLSIIVFEVIMNILYPTNINGSSCYITELRIVEPLLRMCGHDAGRITFICQVFFCMNFK